MTTPIDEDVSVVGEGGARRNPFGAQAPLVLLAWVVVGLAYSPLPAEVRAVAVFGFAVVGPGWALVGLLPPRDLLERLSLAVAVSLSLAALVGEGMAFFGPWNPRGALIVLAAVTTLAAWFGAWQSEKAERSSLREELGARSGGWSGEPGNGDE